jgi:hypothetical protein
MLNDWGYVYLSIGAALAYVEVDLEDHRKQTGGAIAGHGTSTLDPDHVVAKFVLAKCDEILALVPEHDLDPIPTNIELLKTKITTARRQKPHGLEIYTNDILDDVRRIKNDFIVILSKRFFFYVRADLSKHYGRPELFGGKIAKKFKAARGDIEHAGNCLALGESTASVLHLMRAMEGAILQLAKKLHVTINPRATWGTILRDLDAAIKVLPDDTTRRQLKKDLWSECRANLYHVKQAWRDPSMHPRRNYSETQAVQIMAAVQVFLEQLATL